MRISRSEREALTAAIMACEPAPFVAHLRTLQAKLAAKPADNPKPTGVNCARIELALVLAGKGKVAAVTGGSPGFWIQTGRLLTEAGANPVDAETLGTWLSKQAWMTGTLTIDSVARKWGPWLARARAEQHQQQGSADAWSRPEFGDEG